MVIVKGMFSHSYACMPDMGLCDYWISISKCRKILISPYSSKIEKESSYDQVTKHLPLSTPKEKRDIVTNFIWPYLHQFFNDSHSLNGYGKSLKRPFDRY